MITRVQWRKFIDHPVVEWAMFVVGILFLIAALVVGPLRARAEFFSPSPA